MRETQTKEMPNKHDACQNIVSAWYLVKAARFLIIILGEKWKIFRLNTFFIYFLNIESMGLLCGLL